MVVGVVELGVKVTLQEPATNAQVVAENVPAPPEAVNVTVPVGVVAPAPLVSVTVTVQVDGWPIGTVAGVQVMVMLVVLRTPVTVAAAEVLVA